MNNKQKMPKEIDTFLNNNCLAKSRVDRVKMNGGIIFQELGERERILLLKAFDYDVDEEGKVVSPTGERVRSKENPSKCVEAKFASLVPGSLDVIDGTPSAIAEFLVKKESQKNES